jgi:hypothetical protein
MPDSRYCTKCGQQKPLDAFSKAGGGKYGRKAHCKECDAARHRDQYVPKPRGPRREPFTGDEVKYCTRCGESKTLAEFSLSRRATETRNAVYRSVCKACASKQALQWFYDHREQSRASQKRWSLQKLYGLTVERYEALLAAQDGKCAICGTTDPGNGHSRMPVDHDHGTGRVRGLLCHPCNQAIGLLGDDMELLKKAIHYLERAGGYH